MPESANNFSLAELREAVRIIEHSITSDLKYRIQKANNGDILDVYEGPWDAVQFLPQGVVVRKGNQFLLNGERLLVECNSNWMWAGPKGVIMCQKDEILLNGKELLYKFKDNNEFTKDWYGHPCGVVVIENRDMVKGDFVLNGEKLLYSGRYDNCWMIPDGVIVQYVCNSQPVFLLNGKTMYRGNMVQLSSHPKGLIFMDLKGKVWLQTLKKRTLLFDKVPVQVVAAHPRGAIVVDHKGDLFINEESTTFKIPGLCSEYSPPGKPVLSDQPYGNPDGVYTTDEKKKTIKFLVWKA